MKNKLLAIVLLSLISLNIRADFIKKYQGTAKIESKTVYTENHTLTYSEKNILKQARTEYYSADNKLLATLVSDFTKSLSSPDYEMTYMTNGNKEGLRRSGDQIILFDHVAGKSQKVKAIEATKTQEKILMAGQGFNYYLIDNLEMIKDKKILPIRLLIPGKLDYYDFRVKFLDEDKAGNMNFELSVDSWVLRMIAPTLYVKYNKNEKRIVWYKGLSNIPDEKGKTQTVEINYSVQ
jgi:hypothetical protein